MNVLAQLLAWILSVFSVIGLSPAAVEFSSKVSFNNRTALYSTVVARDGVATFRCRESESGTCHYAVFPAQCDDRARCGESALHVFALKQGESKSIVGLTHFHPCVSATRELQSPDCPAQRVP